ncbi:CKLF-like MARVEL transmembrane domain-containing protein 8 [Neocloeon triangulifer]|uniref:CKLF-like MARVEL transmembrane domain-containing protein 8 n=1 Tax=Neocloeon triangulifer TaxID=2078957 RepID=UPI00286F6DF8|nr:CKLF-like MARVEL transmembrane domain-containing protein 8 [Neocloeon triangulifer]XP_059491294.1 CKLF-like MARVEL transmembrane domain-containing protein 8 [Neocloeon triangulifer]
MMSEWPKQQQPAQEQPAPSAPLPPGAPASSGVPTGHGIGSSSGGIGGIQLDLSHFIRTIPGILKLVQFVFGIICIACSAPALLAGTHWFLFVVVTSFLITFLWIIIYLFCIKEVFKAIPWNLVELACHGGISVLYLTAFITQLAIWSPYTGGVTDANLAAGSFGVFNFIAYCGSTYFAYAEWKAEPITS